VDTGVKLGFIAGFGAGLKRASSPERQDASWAPSDNGKAPRSFTDNELRIFHAHSLKAKSGKFPFGLNYGEIVEALDEFYRSLSIVEL
jgi:hypothetical protein